MDGQISIFDYLKTEQSGNKVYALTNKSNSVKLNFFRDGEFVNVEMVFENKMMICRTSAEELKEVVGRL